MIVLVLEQVSGEQHDGLVAGILPPMRNFARLGDDVAGLMHDRHGAIRCVLVDLAVDDVDDGRPVAVAVPGHDPAWLDGELAHAELAVLDVGRLFFHVPEGIAYGQHWLNVKFENSLIRVPFRILTKEEEKFVGKNLKSIKKQVDEAFRPKN